MSGDKPTDPLNVNPNQPQNYSAVPYPPSQAGPQDPCYPPNLQNAAAPNTLPYPDDPPKYTEAYPTPGYPAACPQPNQPLMQGPAPVPGPGPITTANYNAASEQTTYMLANICGAFPTTATCTRCQRIITTKVTYVSGLLCWLLVGLICLFGGIFGCCLIPFCIDECKDVVHSCPICNQVLGSFKRC